MTDFDGSIHANITSMPITAYYIRSWDAMLLRISDARARLKQTSHTPKKQAHYESDFDVLVEMQYESAQYISRCAKSCHHFRGEGMRAGG